MSTLALKGVYWVTVRQHRRTLWLAGALVLLALLVIGALRIWDARTPDMYTDGDHRLFGVYGSGLDLLRGAMQSMSTGMIALPLLVGLFVAGPLIAREFESGTYRLSLTQSVSPAAWFRGKLLTATALALGTALLLTAVYLIGWPRVSGSWKTNWWNPGPYLVTGTTLTAYLLLAIAIGALAGLLIRRTLLAMAATGGVTGLIMGVFYAFRWDILALETATAAPGEPLDPSGTGMYVHQGLISASGERLPGWFCFDNTPDVPCRTDEKVVAQFLDYHPRSHFWPTQLIETTILLTLTALALLAAFRVLRARHA
ncbi:MULTISPECIES: ABC transporter permease subunit [unclassified Streptomyces]|uniref:ABC transporter permease subunit n=1 Tax=unclassified Streptomyces TaxID=2593676 RepID=UPI0016615AE9|nr:MULTISPECIES: ABC transporter permease subunit [unclassified Streptomyces]MBD0712466.1 hypothetical protein [Streptomyces sp. CBMA291]MBD0716840.1 hypothetical protein [Streptomyces sp. CBMA370]